MISWEKLNTMTLAELESFAEELFRKANYRLSRLGESRVASDAYKRVSSYFGAPYIDDDKYYKFKMPSTTDAKQRTNQLRQAIDVAENFLEAQTSTKKGIEQVKRKRRKWVRENFDGFSSNADVDDFLRFLGSSEIQAQKQIFDSNIIVEALATASKNQPSKKLKEIYDEFKASGKSWGGFIIDQEDEWRKRKGIRF